MSDKHPQERLADLEAAVRSITADMSAQFGEANAHHAALQAVVNVLRLHPGIAQTVVLALEHQIAMQLATSPNETSVAAYDDAATLIRQALASEQWPPIEQAASPVSSSND